MHKFSEFAEAKPPLDGKKASLEDVLGKEIAVLNFGVKPTKYEDAKSANCLTVQFYYCDDEKKNHRVFFSGSTVLAEQLNQYKDQLPFQATVTKVGKYYTFS